MLYHLFTNLHDIYDLPGAGLFSYVSFRAGMSLMTSLVVGILFGKRIIERLQLNQVGEIVRDLGLEGQMNKQGTPTMGGLIILGAIKLKSHPTIMHDRSGCAWACLASRLIEFSTESRCESVSPKLWTL